LGELGPELRKLAQTMLDGVDPIVRAAALRASGSGFGAGKCQQAWCPVCALAALVTDEQHPLLTIIAERSIELLAVIRAMVEDSNGSNPPPRPDGPPRGAAAETPTDVGAKSRYQPIVVTVEE
jgi:hypothetical protein